MDKDIQVPDKGVRNYLVTEQSERMARCCAACGLAVQPGVSALLATTARGSGVADGERGLELALVAGLATLQ